MQWTAAGVLAHGLGGRSDLPIPMFLALVGGVTTLIATFVLLYGLWPTPLLAGVSAAEAKPGRGWVHAIFVIAMRFIGLAAFAVTLTALWIGSKVDNVGPLMVYVIVWVGIPLASVVVGDLWKALNPFDTIAAIIEWIGRGRLRRMPDAFEDDGRFITSHWPAALGVAAFSWLELCYHARSEMRPLATIVTIYCAVILATTAVVGREFLRTGEAFGALFTLIAAMAPVTRKPNGRLKLQWPFVGLSGADIRTGTAGLVLVMLGGTTFDGISRSTFWRDRLGDATGWNATIINTFGLLWMIAIVSILYVGAAYAAAKLTGDDGLDAVQRYAHSLVPIALAYSIAHYVSYVLIEGQDLYRFISDPFGRNWDVFGTAGFVIDFSIISQDALGYVKLAAVVVGHLIAVVLAHDRAVEFTEHRRAVRGQLPMLVVMIGYTVGALLLLLN